MKNDSNEPINEVMELKKCTNFSMICTEQKQIPYEISGDPIMKTITATELKNALGAYLEEAKKYYDENGRLSQQPSYCYAILREYD